MHQAPHLAVLHVGWLAKLTWAVAGSLIAMATAVAAVVTGLREVYERMGGRALAVALRILGDRGEAEDVVQEAFVQAWRRAEEYDASKGSMDAWIITIVRNRAIDRRRARVARGRLHQRADDGYQTWPSDLSQRDCDKVRRALDELPDEQRKVLELAYFEGLSQSEIATTLGAPLGTIKTRVRLGMDRLSTTLLGESRP